MKKRRYSLPAFFLPLPGRIRPVSPIHPSDITSFTPAQRRPFSPPGERPVAVPTLIGGLFFKSSGFDDIEFDGRGHKPGE